jgi:hypothetical protein
MSNYANKKIYTIRFHNSNDIYIDFTIQSLVVRFGGHKRNDSLAIYIYNLIQDNIMEIGKNVIMNYMKNNIIDLLGS